MIDSDTISLSLACSILGRGVHFSNRSSCGRRRRFGGNFWNFSRLVILCRIAYIAVLVQYWTSVLLVDLLDVILYRMLTWEEWEKVNKNVHQHLVIPKINPSQKKISYCLATIGVFNIMLTNKFQWLFPLQQTSVYECIYVWPTLVSNSSLTFMQVNMISGGIGGIEYSW